MRTVVGVLRGGPSSEYEISLKSGANVLEHLNQEKYEARDIFIDKDGQWHVHGRALTPEKALVGVDIAFNVLHGEYGENGVVQKLLEEIGIPYTGSDAFTSTIAFNKHTTREIVKKLGVKIAQGVLVEPGDDLDALSLHLFRTFPHPTIIKPVVGGSSVGMTVADSYHALRDGLEHALAVSPTVLVEEFIKGREATVGVIDHFRGQRSYALFPIEIIPPPKHAFFNYEAKYSGESKEICPGNFNDAEKQILCDAAIKVHEALGAKHYSRSDFIVSKRGIYFLEINSAAAVGMTKESLLPKALHAVGSNVPEFLDHVISLAHTR
ncbi:MAG: D-alanine--D-alanine ligase [Patescibacteria group bacterium]|jgi:D-alanine-D-alanine ligase|nr:D-alanine--D-alanine ligase [Patescibacteria group bacterium]